MLCMVKASICRPLVARSPLAASCTCCKSFCLSRISSSIVSVPTIDRSDPSSPFLTIESTCSGFASRNRSAALRSDSTSRPILKVATPCTWTLMPWLVTASLSWTLIWRAVSFSLPTLSSSGRMNVPPPTTTLTPRSPDDDMTWPPASATFAPREPATMRASLALATLYRVATKAMSRMRMITPVTARNGVEVIKLGIRPCSFIAGYWDRGDHEVGTRHTHDLDSSPSGDLGIRGGGQVVGGAGEADQHRSETIGGDSDRHAAGGPNHLFQAEGVGRLCLAQDFEGPKDHCGAHRSRHDARDCPHPHAGAEAVEAEQTPDSKHRDEAEQHRGRGHAGDVKTNVDGPQQAAEDVVDDQGKQQHAAPRKEADAEYEVSCPQAPTSA